jgi:hypothetical protein
VIVSGPSDAEVVVSCDDLSPPHVAPEVMQGPLSRPVGALHGESVELFGRSEAFVSGLDPPLFPRDHLHELDPNEGVRGCLERVAQSGLQRRAMSMRTLVHVVRRDAS